MADTSRVKSTIFVGGLDNRVTQNLLHEAFIPFGDIIEVTLPKPDLPSSTDDNDVAALRGYWQRVQTKTSK